MFKLGLSQATPRFVYASVIEKRWTAKARALPEPHLILPSGTQVVIRVAVIGESGALGRPKGTVGVVVEPPLAGAQRYRIRFADGGEACLLRGELLIRKDVQRDGLELGDQDADDALYERVIFRCVVGSRAYGLAGAESDVDHRGFYLPPAARHWSLAGVPEQLERRETDEVYWEIQKFLSLALKANPNVLECLYTPMIEVVTPLAAELLAMRQIFLSRLVYQTYAGYVLSQFKRLEADLRIRGELKWKHVMHLLRLLLAGITVLKDGLVPLDVAEHRDQLMAIRRGELPWTEVDAWRLSLHRELDAAFAATTLPERPDFARANAFLVKARRQAAAEVERDG